VGAAAGAISDRTHRGVGVGAISSELAILIGTNGEHVNC
jgi:hypothetical protein